MLKFLLILCAVIYSTHGLGGYPLKTGDEPANSAFLQEIGIDGVFNSDRRSIYAMKPAPAPAPKPDRRSMLDRAVYAQNYLNQAVEAKQPKPRTLIDILKPFPRKEEQSQYLLPNSETFRNLRQAIAVRRANEEVALTNEEKARDASMKAKISLIVDQTLKDAEERVKSVAPLKEEYKNDPAFKIGFIMVMIKKSRDVMNELFNVAVKHRDQWQALEQLKIFELIVHTNADTTTLVQQMLDLHTQAGGSLSDKNKLRQGHQGYNDINHYRGLEEFTGRQTTARQSSVQFRQS